MSRHLAETVGAESTWRSCTACSQWDSAGCTDSVWGCSAEAQIEHRSQTEGLENTWGRRRKAGVHKCGFPAFEALSILALHLPRGALSDGGRLIV